MKSIPQAITLAIALACATEAYSKPLQTKPNVILIYTDDQGYGDASCMNAEAKFQTPHIDRIAREGLRFTDAHCSDTVCTPSRYGLLTGRYSWRTQLKRGVLGPEDKCLIASDRMTLASLLKAHDYQTAMVGKWHLGMSFPGVLGNRNWKQPVRDMPLDKGFEYFFGIPASMNYGVLAWFEGRFAAQPPTLFTAKKPNALAISDYRIQPPYEATPEETARALGKHGMEVAPDFVDHECLTRFTDKAITWLQRATSGNRRSRPFFLYLPFTSPHKPVIPLPEFRGQGEAGAYGEFMIETDHHVGRLLKFLDDQNLAEETLIIFTSDNGPETTWKERLKRYQHASNGGMREGKRSIYEGGHRVPMLVRWPSKIQHPGRVCPVPVCQTDVLATVAEIIGAKLPHEAGEDSQSMAALWFDPKADMATRRPMMHHAAIGRFAIRDGDWKLVLPHLNRAAELYHLKTDPTETNDVIAANPHIAKTLTAAATEIVGSGRTTLGTPQPNDTGYWNDLKWITPQRYSSLQAASQ